MIATAEVALQLLSVGCGFYAAYLWWKSSDNIQLLSSMPKASAGTGDLLVQTGPNEFILYNNQAQAKLNKAAAIWTATSVALQAATVAVKFF